MRHFLIIILAFFINSCYDNKLKFEKDYYERVSGIKFPEKYEVLETFDNFEWITGTVFKIDSSALIKFVTDNHFDTVQNLQDIHLISSSYLKKYKPNLITTKNIYFISKGENSNKWIYVADLNNDRLWTEIRYPDWGGQ